jgi:hypothetical protein
MKKWRVSSNAHQSNHTKTLAGTGNACVEATQAEAVISVCLRLFGATNSG